MLNTVYQLIRTIRPRQWLKNLSVFAGPVFLGTVFEPKVFYHSMQALVVFCFVSSGTYLINDIIDAPKDRLHPIKKNRPIASGKLPVPLAWVVAFIFIIGSIIYSATNVGSFFALAIIGYVLLQIAYSTYLRNVIILDSLTVATGFVVRVFAGGLASSSSLSSWLILATIGLSLLLAFGKRRSEKTLVAKHMAEIGSMETRATLRHYPDSLLDSMISTSASFCIITYALFVFQVSPDRVNHALSSFLPSILSSPRWMMLTVPMVIYGVARYLYVIYEKNEGESPERVLLSDRPLLLTVILWGAFIMLILYVLSGPVV